MMAFRIPSILIALIVTILVTDLPLSGGGVFQISTVA